MKKFTLMLIAALMAVTSWAGVPADGSAFTPKKKAELYMRSLVPMQKQVTPKQFAGKAVQAPAHNKLYAAARTAAKAKKAPRKAGILDGLTNIDGQLMLVSSYYETNDDGEIVDGEPAAGGWPISVTKVDDETVAIEGFTSYADQSITAKVAPLTDEELLEQGFVAQATIELGQTLAETDYGTVVLGNAVNDNPLTAYITSTGILVVDGLWYDYIKDGQYADYMYSGYIYESVVTIANGTMNVAEQGGEAQDFPVVIIQDEEALQNVMVFNFAGQETAITVTIKEDASCVVNEQYMFYSDQQYGAIYTTGLLIQNGSYYVNTFTGNVDANVITFDGNWALYSPTGGALFGIYEANTTITLNDGSEFAIPVIPDVAAVPADPAVYQLGAYNASKGYGYVALDIPTTDADGNLIKESKLYYQLYSDIEHDVQPIVFTPDLYENLTEDMTEIPYTFTDKYDFDVSGAYKLVFLNYDFSDYNRIGVKSIYKGGDAVNETEIQWYDIKDYAPELPDGQTLAQWVAAEQGYTNAQDITEFKIGDYITVTLAQNESTTHPKYYTSGSALRIYDLNSFTFEASAEVESIDKIVLNFASSTYNGYLSTDVETYTVDGATGTWEGTANDVTFINDKSSADAASNKQARIVSIDVYYTMVAEPKPEGLYDFAEGTLDPWTTIDADGDGYDWTIGSGAQINARGGDDDYAVYSQSYVNGVGAVEPDNYLVSPKIKLDGSISFYACAQDAKYFAEHFGVYVSTKGNTDPADFEKVQEWDMAASRAAKVSRGAFRAPAKAAGQWHEYTVDLSGYEGAEGYVAIRHFDCTDFFFLVVDDITLKTSKVILPDMTVTPKEGVVESIETVTVDFNNYMIELVDADNAKAELYKDDNWDEPVATAPIYEIGGKQLYISFPEAITEAGEYALLIPKGTFMNSITMEKNDDEAFFYTIEAEPEVVVLPEGAELQTWYLTANAHSGKVKGDEVSVAFVGSDLYVQGLNSYLPEAWVMGTSNGDGTYTFANGQYYGEYDNDGEPVDMFFCGTSDAENVSDVTFTYQEEAGILSTEQYVLLNSNATTISVYDYYEPGLQITSFKPEFPEPLVAPEDLVTETYLFKGFDTYEEEEESGREVQVGFYGDNEVWFQGLSNFLPEAWVKGTIDSDGNVTIPETYLGVYQYLDWNTFSVVEIEMTFGTATFKYDAEAFKFTSEEGFTSFDEDGYTMDEYTDVELTKVIEKEATPADPSVDIFALYYTPGEESTELQFRTFPYASFDIPTVDINGEPMVTDKLGYIVYIVDKDGVEQKLTITSDLYTKMPEGTTEMTEIPYKYDDSYDIYAGGETFYLNWNAEEIATWQKIGVQSVYHGLGIEHTSNIGWFDIQQYIADLQAMLPTGISQVSNDAEGARFFDLQGRRADKSQKGLLIMQTSNGKTVKVIRK